MAARAPSPKCIGVFLTIIKHYNGEMALCRQATEVLPEPMLTKIQDAIWCHTIHGMLTKGSINNYPNEFPTQTTH